jgi:post-segregation antitoxin (ccd killing protein)
MRAPDYDTDAPKQTVSLTLNSDLYARAKRIGINASRVAEQALAEAYGRERAARLAMEARQDLDAVAAYEKDHGAFADQVRAHFAGDEGGERDADRDDAV